MWCAAHKIQTLMTVTCCGESAVRLEVFFSVPKADVKIHRFWIYFYEFKKRTKGTNNLCGQQVSGLSFPFSLLHWC